MRVLKNIISDFFKTISVSYSCPLTRYISYTDLNPQAIKKIFYDLINIYGCAPKYIKNLEILIMETQLLFLTINDPN